MSLGAIYCTVFVAVAVWIGLMMFTQRSGRQRWSEPYLHRLRHELDELLRSTRGASETRRQTERVLKARKAGL